LAADREGCVRRLVAKGLLERIFDPSDFNLAKSRQGLQSVRGRSADVRKAAERGTQCFDVGLVDLVYACKGSAQLGVIVFVDTLLDEVRWLVFELLERCDVLASFVVAPCDNDGEIVDQAHFCELPNQLLVFCDVTHDEEYSEGV